MLARYAKDKNGKLVKQADVYTKEEHGITSDRIDADAFFITKKLKAAGFEAYIVGGAVRDLLLGRKPKDFDVATNAHPRAIKKVLPFSRIIGKRFRLVHVYFPGDKIIEVATFRSNHPTDANVFGTLEEDVRRRDFTLNALFYDPKDEYIIDHVGGVQDIRKRRLNNVIPLKTIFEEDPVRMLRAVKYATVGGFSIPWNIASEIKKKAPQMAQISPSRLTEEFFKILQSGLAARILPALHKYRILEFFFPRLAQVLKLGAFNPGQKALKEALDLLDAEVSEGKAEDRADQVAYLILPLLLVNGWEKKATTENYEEIVQWIKDWFKPIIPSNREVDATLRNIYRGWAIRPPRRRPPRRRGSGGGEKNTAAAGGHSGAGHSGSPKGSKGGERRRHRPPKPLS